jgi:hypothetical protein
MPDGMAKVAAVPTSSVIDMAEPPLPARVVTTREATGSTSPHAAARAGLTKPLPQVLQEAAATPEYCPAVHGVQDVAPVAEFVLVPAGHGRHAVAPESGA